MYHGGQPEGQRCIKKPCRNRAMAPLKSLGDFGRFGCVNIQSFFDTSRGASGLAACASAAATSGHSHARCHARWRCDIGSFALSYSPRYFAVVGGGGKNRGPASPPQRYRANYAELWRPISSSAYWGEAAQRLSWRCVATDPKQTVPVVRSTRLPAATKAGLLNER